MKVIFRFIYFSLLACLLVGCKQQSNLIIKWDGGSHMDDITYTINGKNAGKGFEGFQKMVDTLRSQENGMRFKVYFPVNLWNHETSDDPKNLDPFPFREHENLKLKFEEVMVAKRLSFEQLGFESKIK